MTQTNPPLARRSRRKFLALLALAAALAIFAACLRRPRAAEPARAASPGAAGDSAAVQTHRNLGKGYYEQGKYPEATQEFRQVVATGQALATDHLDLGLALIQDNNPDAALGELTTAKQIDPKLLAADYNLGILYKRELRYPEAEAALKHVTDADPRDPAAWFNLGAVYFAQKKLELALDAHQRVVAMGFGRAQNFYVASLFHTFTLLVRLKRKPEADKVLELHTKVKDKVPNISLQNPALEGGKYGAILVPIAAAVTTARKVPERISFDDITARLAALPGAWMSITMDINPGVAPASLEARFWDSVSPAVATGDYNADGRPDIFYCTASGDDRLLRNKGNGSFEDVTEKARLAQAASCLSATFADYNNSGHPSLFVVGPSGIRLYKNNGDGTFSDSTEKAGLTRPPGGMFTRALLFDADNDGFLDLIVTGTSRPKAPGRSVRDDNTTRFFRNNGDETFSDVTEASGLASARGFATGGAFSDLNNDGYVDLVVTRADGPPFVYLNQGEGKFSDRSTAAGADLAAAGPAYDVQVADFNHDGNFDLALWTASGIKVLMNDGKAEFKSAALPPLAPPAGGTGLRGAIADLNGDGFDDLLLQDGSGAWHAILNFAGNFKEAPLALAARGARGLGLIVPAALQDPGKLDLLATARDGQLVAYEKHGPPARWSEVKLDGFKSNTQGVGTLVEFKAGNFYKKVAATGGPVRVFTGDLAKLDVVRVTWPNQIVQNNLEVTTNQVIKVRESERLASSCPFLYVWNGSRFVFFTDILGVAPLGELAPDGSRLKPNPEELVRLPEDLAAHDGLFTFEITDELREVDFLDQARLVAVDHPAGEDVLANEIYSSLPAPPRLYAVREKRAPVSAVDDNGGDVLPLIREPDGRYPSNFRRDRILGLAGLHTLTLDLGPFPAQSPVALWLEGWVFWTDSNASRALLSNSKQTTIAPYLQVRDAHGQWITALPDMGLPSGTNRTMRVNLTGKFPSPDHQVRIVTNLCVYWDQIFASFGDTEIPAAPVTGRRDSTKVPPPGMNSGRRTTLPLVSADLHYRGFSAPSSDPEHLRPDTFDYQNVLAEAPWNPRRGSYTRYGSVEKLVRRADDELVVMATGDELTLQFSGRDLPPVAPGWKRSLFLYVRGFAKDGEPNTAFSSTVDPLPFFHMPNYPPEKGVRRPQGEEYRLYLTEYETRPARLLIPPLAPFLK